MSSKKQQFIEKDDIEIVWTQYGHNMDTMWT